MRPTDENQSPSMRPNLMSPRRTTSGEDSILAMLEREPARKRARGSSGPRLAWYGASAMVVLALTGALVWMAANNDGLRPDVDETVLAEAASASQRNTPPAHPAGAATILQVAMAPEAQPAGAAVIVDQAPPADAVPPLRLLKPGPEASAAQKPASDRPAPPAATATPARAPAPVAAAPARPVAKTSPSPGAATVAPAEARALARPAATPAKSRPVMVAKQGARPVQPKGQRGVTPARTADGPVDADVALISAVIVHANGHAPEGSQMTELLCPNDSCQARPSRQ